MGPRDPEMPDFHEEGYSSEGFIEWKKGKPTPLGYVQVILRDGTKIGDDDSICSEDLDWSIDGCPQDVAWYKLC